MFVNSRRIGCSHELGFHDSAIRRGFTHYRGRFDGFSSEQVAAPDMPLKGKILRIPIALEKSELSVVGMFPSLHASLSRSVHGSASKRRHRQNRFGFRVAMTADGRANSGLYRLFCLTFQTFNFKVR